MPPGLSPMFSHSDKLALPLSPSVPPSESSSSATPAAAPRSNKACRPCRARKVKCNGEPICSGCLARNITCGYDAKQKRRGPDKIPGARRRRPGPPKERPGQTPTSAQTQIHDPDALVSLSTRASLSQADHPQLLPNPTIVDTPHHAHTLLPHASTASGTSRQAYDTSVFDKGLAQLTTNVADLSNADSIKELSGQAAQPHHSRTSHTGPVSAAISVAGGVFAWRNNRIVWDNASSIILGPSLQYYRESWWDALLAVYSPDRQTAVQTITSDLKQLFHQTSKVLSFIRVPQFINALLYPQSRERIQPSLPLSALALYSLMLSIGSQRQVLLERAMLLQSAAHAAFEASINAGWFDPNLVQAAVMLVLFEISPHPSESDNRVMSAFLMMDAIISCLSLPSLDATDPSASIFLPNVVPTVSPVNPQIPPKSHPEREWASTLAVPQLPALSDGHLPLSSPSLPAMPSHGCNCASMYATSDLDPGSPTSGRSWVPFPGYHPYWTEAMIEREQNRNVVWSALGIFTAHSAHRVALTGPRLKFRNARPSNFALLFPGEALHISRGYASAGKDSVWALYCRALLLLNSCWDMRDSDLPDSHERASFALDVWLETSHIEEALNRHECKTEEYYFWAGRQYLQLVRMAVTYEFSKYVPSVHTGRVPPQRKETEEWLGYVQFFAKVSDNPRFLTTMLAHLRWNPYLIWIFVDQISRCLRVWDLDNTLITSLQVAKEIAPALDTMLQMYPESSQLRGYRDRLISRLHAACNVCNIPSPISPLSL